METLTNIAILLFGFIVFPVTFTAFVVMVALNLIAFPVFGPEAISYQSAWLVTVSVGLSLFLPHWWKR